MRGEFLFPEGNTLLLLKLFLVPGYLVFCGIMIGYLMFIFWSWRLEYKDNTDKNKLAIKLFLLGFVLWIIFACFYVFM